MKMSPFFTDFAVDAFCVSVAICWICEQNGHLCLLVLELVYCACLLQSWLISYQKCRLCPSVSVLIN